MLFTCLFTPYLDNFRVQKASPTLEHSAKANQTCRKMNSLKNFLVLILATTVVVSKTIKREAVSTVFTVDCKTVATQRMDPIVFPGRQPVGHVHAIAGASRFNESVTYKDLQESKCTTCNAGQDLSNYWVPQLYVQKKRDGKFHHIPMEFSAYYKLINDR